MSEIILARYRNTKYTVRCEVNGNVKRYEWAGSKGKKIDRKKVPKDVADWLTMNTVCFDKGALVIEGDQELTKDLKADIVDKESYDKNTHTQEDVEKILRGNYKKLEKELNEITVQDEKKFVVDVAKDIKDDLTGGKQKLIAEWYGQEVDILFGQDVVSLTTYDEIWKLFINKTKIDIIEIPNSTEAIHDTIKNAVLAFNVRLEDDLQCDNDNEIVNRELKGNELTLLTHFIRLIIIENQAIYFSTTYSPFTKELGVRNLSNQNNRLKDLMEREDRKIEEIIMMTMDDYL